jgi:hypothetical protein
MKKGANKKNGVDEQTGFETIRIRRTTFLKLKAYKEDTRVPMSAFVDKAVDERLKKLKYKL